MASGMIVWVCVCMLCMYVYCETRNKMGAGITVERPTAAAEVIENEHRTVVFLHRFVKTRKWEKKKTNTCTEYLAVARGGDGCSTTRGCYIDFCLSRFISCYYYLRK